MTITGAARLAGVMGWPVSHSRSPVLHNFWLREYGIDGVYMPLAVAPEAFERALGALALLGFAGVNVTVPHKEAAFAAVDEMDRLAKRIGAVNTIVFDDDGGARGTNTDAFGFVESLRTRVPGWSGAAGPAVVLGAPNALMTWPASPPVRIRRVLATFRPRRKSVVKSRIVGKVDNSVDALAFMVTISNKTAAVMFNARSRSKTMGGMGITSVISRPNTPKPRNQSE